MSFVAVGAVGGLALSAYGAYSSNQAAGDAAKQQANALNGARTSIGDWSTTGSNGMGASYNQNTGQVEYGVGNLAGAQRSLSNFATSSVPTAGSQLPSNVSTALQQAQWQGQQSPDLGLGELGSLQNGTNNVFGQAQNQLQQAFQPYQQGLQNSAFAGAGTALNNLNQSYQSSYDTTLSNLRSQAATQNDRAFTGLQNNQFATGRLGTSGGALQTEAFAKGLASADAGYQLQAQQQAQMTQQNQLALAQGQAGIGTGLASQGDDLLNSAFNRFTQTSSQLQGLSDDRFQRSMYGNQLATTNSQTNLGNQITAAGLPSQLQGAQLQNVLAALQGQQGIDAQGQSQANLGLSSAQAGANARIGSGSNVAAIVGSPSFGAAGQAQAATIGQLGSAISNGAQNGYGGLVGQLGSLFGGSSSQTPAKQTGPVM
jgi:hypothetical protein